MQTISLLGLLAGSSWASGINVYLTVAGLGIAHRMDWIQLPGSLDVISNPLIILIAVILYAIEFCADKIPYVDSAWDTVHTLVRPFGGALLAYLAMAESPAVAQMTATLVGGTVALDAHLTKATARAAINTSPEPVTNSVASVTEDVGVLGALFLIIKHPVVMTVLVVVFIVFSIWFLKVMFKFLKKVLASFGKKSKEESLPIKEASVDNQ